MIGQSYKINRQRLLSAIQISSEYGTLPNGGLCRLALSKEDKQMRDLFLAWMKECGLEVRVDDAGNMYGRREGSNPEVLPVVVGSHLDTQPIGGKYDGILGVMAALEAVRTLNDHNSVTERPIEIVNFTNEEGARFLPSMLGSGIVANVFQEEEVTKIRDKDGLGFIEELEKIGYRGSKENRLKDLFCFLELHIEQGPVLEASGKTIGAVSGIQGISCLEVIVSGKTGHAGTTPMENRKDAMWTAANMIREIYQSCESGTNILVTVGQIQAFPNVTNSVADKVVFSVDIRHHDDSVRHHFANEIKEKLSTMALIEKMDLQIQDLMDMEAETFASDVINEIEGAAGRLGYPSMRLVSGAGHDAKYMNQMAPSGMIFIPSIGGVSHCEEEFSKEQDIAKGAQVLLDVIVRLANRKENIQR